MSLSLRRFAPILFVACAALLTAGCSSNNKGKIEGKWKFVSFPEKTTAKNKNDMAEMSKLGIYVYMEFKADATVTIGVGADKPEVLEMLKAFAPKEQKDQLTQSAKYKLLSGDTVELYDLPKDLQNQGGGMFGNKDRAKVKIVINGDDMKMTDDGTATLAKLK